MLKSIATAAALALATAGGANAAITFDLTGSPASSAPSYTFTESGLSVEATAKREGLFGPVSVDVTQDADGLGATWDGIFTSDSDPNLDSFVYEILTFSFTPNVKLGSVAFSLFDVPGDDYTLKVNGVEIASGVNDNPYNFGWVEAGSFSIQAVFGDDPTLETLSGLYDSFRVQSITVAAVPVPAAGLMLVGALGGMAAYRRRQKKAA